MSEGGLTVKQQKAIAALLSHRTTKEAAKACGVTEMTLWRWLQEPGFSAEYRKAQRAVVDNAIAKLQAATDKAVDTFIKNLDSPNDFASNMAAGAILSQAFKAIEVRELKDEIDEIKRQLAGRKGLKQA